MGSAIVSNLPFDQLKRPDSTTTPAMEVPCPPMNLVAEWTTMSAPHSIGRQRYGEANVLSIDQRDLVAVGDLGDGLDVEDVGARVADRLAVEHAWSSG